MAGFLLVQYTQLALQSRDLFVQLNLSLHFDLPYFLLTLYSNVLLALELQVFVEFLVLLHDLLLDPFPFLNSSNFRLTLAVGLVQVVLQKPNHPDVLLFLIVRVFSKFGFFCLYFYPFRRPGPFFSEGWKLLRGLSLNLNHKCFSVRSTLLSPFRLKSLPQLVLHHPHFFDFALVDLDQFFVVTLFSHLFLNSLKSNARTAAGGAALGRPRRLAGLRPG